MRPSQPREVIQQRLGKVASLAVGKDRGRAVPLGKLLPVRPHHHRQMRVGGWREPERIKDLHLARRVGQMVVAAHDVSDAEVGVVEHGGEVIGRHAVGAKNDQVVELRVVEHGAPLDEIVDHGLARARRAKANRIVAAGALVGQREVRGERQVAALAVVAGFAMLAFGLLALGFQFLGGAVAGVGFFLAQQLERALAISIEAARLKVTAVGRPLVPLHPEPAQALEDFFERLLGGAFLVGVVDTQDEFAAVVAREQVREQSRAHVADMQRAGGAWRVTGTNGHAVATPIR